MSGAAGTGQVMKVVLSGVSHWHTPLYLEPLLKQPGVKVVGIADPDIRFAERLSARLGCPSDASLTRLCSRVTPDLAFVLGRHSNMAADVRYLISTGIPLVVEKPAGTNAAEVAHLAAAAKAATAFAAVPLVFRTSGYFSAIREIAANEDVMYAGFKFIAGLPSRYRESGCEWVFDRALSGGGVLMNLGVHFIDLLQLMMPGIDLTSAEFANLHGEGNVEDYVSLMLKSGGQVGAVESGYLYPAPGGIFDMHFSVRTEKHYFTATGPGRIEVSDLKGNRRELQGSTTNMPIYPEFVEDVIKRVRDGAPPVANLDDMANVMRIVDGAYAMGGKGAMKRSA